MSADVTKSCTPRTSYPPLTPLCKSFVAGILCHARAIHAFAAPTPSCYVHHHSTGGKDFGWEGHHNQRSCGSNFYWLGKGCPPTHINFIVDTEESHDSKGAMIRIKEGCLEIRSPTAASNPYLVLASIIAAGLDGVDNEMNLADHVVSTLPVNLTEALDALEGNDLIVDSLGRDFVDLYISVKRNEVDAINRASGGNVSKVVSSELLEQALQTMYLEMI